MSSFDLNAVQSFMNRITDQILEKGKRILGFSVQPGPRCGHMIGFRPISKEMVEYLTPETMEVANMLKEKNIFLSVQCGAFRIAPYLDSTSEDVDRLMEALEEESQPPTGTIRKRK